MSLVNASSYNSLTWSQQQLNPGFSSTYQGPDTFSYAKNYIINQYGISKVHAATGTLDPSTSTTIDLQNLVDFFNNPMILTRIYSIQLSAVDADLLFKPAATNGCKWFFNDFSDGLVIKANSDLMYNTSMAFDVVAGASCLTIENLDATTVLTYKIAILGGDGPSTTPTPTPTMSPAPTALPTETPVPSGTPIPTPSPTI